MNPGAWRWPALGLVALVVAAVLLLPGRSADAVMSVVEWMRSAGALGVVVFALLYVLGTLAMFPGSVLTMAGGFAYGLLGGFFAALGASLVGATLAFWIGRSAGRGWVTRLVERDPRLAAVDRAVENRGFQLMLLLRLSPVVPYSPLNYALGLTLVSTRAYVLAAMLGMLPGTLLYVYLGTAITNVGELFGDSASAEATTWGGILYWGGLLLTLVAVAWISRVAHSAVREALAEQEHS